MAKQAPSSSSFTYQWKYDVFLNFRGVDTRFDFTRNLYNDLDRKGIHTFVDDEGLRRGEEITPALLKAIEESRIAITIFSKNYASSTFCLDELVKILESVKEKGRLVLPVFYGMDPSEVRHQRETYGEAFRKHEKKFENNKEKVRKWRQALHDVANLSGLPFKPGQEYEFRFIERIAREVSRRINRNPLHIADYPVGIEARVRQVISLLDLGSNEGVQMVGICGIGGIGKSTIARAVYNLIADAFDGVCFIADVRENSIKHGVVHLQEMLLYEIVEEDIKLVDVSKGIPIIKHRLQQKKVLLVLDDVDDQKQLQATTGGLDWFGSGSRIIITTRDKHLLARHGVVKTYEVESLYEEESLELLKWNAFGHNKDDPSYMKYLKEVARYTCGLPLALEVIGSNLFNREPDDWDSALDTYRRIPNRKIQQILKVSYDDLEENEQEIFLDIACCFNEDKLEYVRSALYARGGICPDYGIEVLMDKCLIKIVDDFVRMHDLIRGMGREIVRRQSPKEPGERTRLWFYEDILQVLEENKGTKKIEAINLNMPRYEEVDWNGRAFEEMPNLKILIIRNARFSTGPKYLPNNLRVLEWTGYPYPSLPSDFYPRKLVILKMSKSCLKLDEQFKVLHEVENLKFVIQNDEIPEWLDHYAMGHSVSFWIRKKFPNMAVCFSTERGRERNAFGTNVDIKFRINGIDIGLRHEVYHSSNGFKRTFLFDMQGALKDKLKNLVLGPEWNHVQISCLASFTESVPYEIQKYALEAYDTMNILLRVNWVGIYVYKKKFRMVDVQFTNPSEESPLDLEGSSTNPNFLAKEHHWELLLHCEPPGCSVTSLLFG